MPAVSGHVGWQVGLGWSLVALWWFYRGYAELERFGGSGRLDSRFLLAHNIC